MVPFPIILPWIYMSNITLEKYSCTIYSAYTDADIDTYLYMIWYNNVFHAIEKAEGPNFF